MLMRNFNLYHITCINDSHLLTQSSLARYLLILSLIFILFMIYTETP